MNHNNFAKLAKNKKAVESAEEQFDTKDLGESSLSLNNMSNDID
jgi:hypothetical protein